MNPNLKLITIEMKLSRAHLKFLDCLFVGVLICYGLAGARLVPFHGDESTILYMSLDWFRTPSEVAFATYSPGSGEATNQELRLLNGVLSKDSYGAAFALMGIAPSQINTPWDWGNDW